MSLLAMIVIVGFSGAVIGINKGKMGGIPGLLMTPLLFYSAISPGPCSLFFHTLLLFTVGLAYGFISSTICSGLKGGGTRHNIGPFYIMGFGAHHAGGIILSTEEDNAPKEQNTGHNVFISY